MTGLRLLLVGLLVVSCVLQIEAITKKKCRDNVKAEDWYKNHNYQKLKNHKHEDNVKNFRKHVKYTKFDNWFPNRKSKYSYKGLLMGIAANTIFCETKDSTELTDNNCKKDIASFFGLVRQETGSLKHLEEDNWESKLEEYDCKDGKNKNGEGDLDCSWCDSANNKRYSKKTHYYGRGALQLSWNCNYGKASKELYGDRDCLLQHPDLVKDENMLFTSALWFWQNSLQDKDNFAQQIQEINGDQECGPCPTTGNKNSAHCRHFYMEYYAGKVGFTDAIAETFYTTASMGGFKEEGKGCHDPKYSSHSAPCGEGRDDFTEDDDKCKS